MSTLAGTNANANANANAYGPANTSPGATQPALAPAAGRRLVLVGAGHAHLQVLRAWARAPVPGCSLVLVSPQARTAYPGMVPGWLAGHCRFEALCIDAAALARAAGATWLATELRSLDAAARRLTLADGQTLDFDLLSLNIGSAPHAPAAPPNGRVLSLQPPADLKAGWDALLQDPWLLDDPGPLAVTAVDAGPLGVETLLALCARLRRELPHRTLLPHLVGRDDRLLPGLAPSAVDRVAQALQAAGVQLTLGVDAQRLLRAPAANPGLLLWAAGAPAPGCLQGSGLALDTAGRVRTDAQLRSVSHPQVLAVGAAAGTEPALPQASASALRQCPVLLHNLRGALQGRPLRAFVPQQRPLVLLATGEGRAVAACGDWSAEGAWLWRWKYWRDRRFVAGFRVPPGPL